MLGCLQRLRSVFGVKKKQYTDLSDRIKAYGPLPDKLPYEAEIGLWLNTDRSRARFSQDVAKSLEIYFQDATDPDFLRALARDEREAAELASAARLAKKAAEAAARHGF